MTSDERTLKCREFHTRILETESMYIADPVPANKRILFDIIKSRNEWVYLCLGLDISDDNF